MKRPRPRFTLRWMMIAVAIVALIIAAETARYNDCRKAELRTAKYYLERAEEARRDLAMHRKELRDLKTSYPGLYPPDWWIAPLRRQIPKDREAAEGFERQAAEILDRYGIATPDPPEPE